MDTGAAEPLFASPNVVSEDADDGSVVLRSADTLGAYPSTVMHSVRAWADLDPDHLLVAERGLGRAWRLQLRRGGGSGQRDRPGPARSRLGPDRPLLVLSGNGVDHMLMTLGAMTAGVPVAPASVAYSLQSRDHAHLRAIAEPVRPGAVFAENGDRFAAALDAVSTVPAIVSAGERPGAERFDEFARPCPARPLPRRSMPWTRTRWRRSCSPRARPGPRRACSIPTGCCPPTSR